jgi:hypothetical protein
MKQSKRIQLFGLGFLAGALIAVGIAFLRPGAEEPPPAPLPVWESVVAPASSPPLLDPGERRVKEWRLTDNSTRRRWLVEDAAGHLWRFDSEEPDQPVRADRIRVQGNGAMQPATLRAGLDHNEFPILREDTANAVYIVEVSPFRANAIERAIRTLESRTPYILGAEPLRRGGEVPGAVAGGAKTATGTGTARE